MQILTLLLLALAADTPAARPAGYPPAPAGFHWALYPGGSWGLVQEGLADPLSPLAAAGRAAAPAPASGADGLDEVNALRARRGLPPYERDAGLTVGAKAASEYRAAHLLFGHTRSDFAFLPPGVTAASAGCAAYPPNLGWLSCDVWERNRRAGAWWTLGSDGKRYMHLFVR